MLSFTTGTSAPTGEVQIERRRITRTAIGADTVARLARQEGAHLGTRPVASVLVIDDHSLLGDVIVGTIRREGFPADAIAPSTSAAVLDRVRELSPTVALLDLDLGSASFDGLDLIEPLLERGVDVVVLLNHTEPLLVAASLEAGARAVLSKSDPFTTVLDTVKAVARGELQADASERDALRRLLREERRDHAQRAAPFRQLTPREREVLAHLMEGSSAEGIAAASYVSLATVRTQIRGVLTKLGVSSQLGAVAAARACGWTGEEIPMARYSATLRL